MTFTPFIICSCLSSTDKITLCNRLRIAQKGSAFMNFVSI